tara:strand:- start:32 stop:817 length:786 start_codon:yes stop_codon:yes gene_type:complete
MITYHGLGTNGRFGNQLFQYASLLGMATVKGYDYGVPYKRKSNDDYANFCLPDCFINLKAKDCSDHISYLSAREEKFPFDESFFNLPDNTDIWGYFQTEKYFKQYKNEILNQFVFNKEIKDICNNFIEPYKNENITAVHLRLGDYLIYSDSHPVCKEEYYIMAMQDVPKDSLIFVFSDDIPKAKMFFKYFDKKIIYPEFNNKFLDMCLMTMCNNHIIANSSFSWWGAWLANSNKVIAPSIWFGPNIQKDWSDIYCEGWKII